MSKTLFGFCNRYSDLNSAKKGWAVFGTVFGDIHLKYLLGSIARVGIVSLFLISIQCFIAFHAEKAL